MYGIARNVLAADRRQAALRQRAEEFGRGLGDAPMLFDWYFDGDTLSQVLAGFKLSEPSARFFNAVAARVGAAVAGRTTYEHSGQWGGGGPHPAARPPPSPSTWPRRVRVGRCRGRGCGSARSPAQTSRSR